MAVGGRGAGRLGPKDKQQAGRGLGSAPDASREGTEPDSFPGSLFRGEGRNQGVQALLVMCRTGAQWEAVAGERTAGSHSDPPE